MENAHPRSHIHASDEVEIDCWSEIIQRKTGWISVLKSGWYCIPFVGDLEVKRVMSLWSVEQQPGVLACMDKSRLRTPEVWNKPAQNYLVDKGRSKGKAKSTNENLQYLYKSHFCPSSQVTSVSGGCSARPKLWSKTFLLLLLLYLSLDFSVDIDRPLVMTCKYIR